MALNKDFLTGLIGGIVDKRKNILSERAKQEETQKSNDFDMLKIMMQNANRQELEGVKAKNKQESLIKTQENKTLFEQLRQQNRLDLLSKSQGFREELLRLQGRLDNEPDMSPSERALITNALKAVQVGDLENPSLGMAVDAGLLDMSKVKSEGFMGLF